MVEDITLRLVHGFVDALRKTVREIDILRKKEIRD